MESAEYRIEVFYRGEDPRCVVMKDKLRLLGYPLTSVSRSDNYLISGGGGYEAIEEIARSFRTTALIRPVCRMNLITQLKLDSFRV